jgi:DNA-binding transcriptional LysR family regulator
MRTRHLEVLHAILQTGSVSNAARVLSVSQPAVSKILQHAEVLAGYPLFRRAGQRLVPTAELLALRPLIDDISAQMDVVRHTVRNLKQGAAQCLRVAAVPALATGLLSAACARVSAAHPALQFELASGNHDELATRIFERAADAAVAFDPTPHPLLQPTPLGTLTLVCAGLPKLLGKFAKRTTVSAEALASMPLIALAGRDPVGKLYLRHAAEHGWNAPVFTVQTYQIALELAARGQGVAVVDSASASRFKNQLSLLRLEPLAAFPVVALSLKDAPVGEAVTALHAALRVELVELAATAP